MLDNLCSVILSLFVDWRLYCICILLYVVAFYTRFTLSGLPRGPLPLPLIGNLHQLGKKLHVEITKLGKTYGKVFTVYFANQPVVILNDYQAVYEGFVKNGEVTSARPSAYMIVKQNPGKQGIVFSDGNTWKQQKHFASKVMRDLGVGKPILEQKIQEEAAVLVQCLRSENEQAFNPRDYFVSAVSNIICGLLFDKRFDYDDAEFVDIVYTLSRNVHLLMKCAPLNSFPWLRYIPGDIFGHREFFTNKEKIYTWCRCQVKEHYGASDKEESRDYISHYLKEQNAREVAGKLDTFTDQNLIISLSELFVTGTETVVTSLLWTLIHLIHNPDVAHKVHREIDNVIGQQRPPCWKDRSEMPYTEAVINEVHRISSIVPLASWHVNISDIVVCGHRIPAGSWIMPNIHNVHYDQKYWDHPERFDPSRFLGKSNLESFMPFNLGPRVCLGENIAKMELFIFITTLMQNFIIEAEDCKNLPSTKEGEFGITFVPLPYKIVVKNRLL